MIQLSLFISNFKQKSKVFIQMSIFVCIFLLGVQCMNYLYQSETNDWSRILWHNFYTQQENIDCLYLGSSHVYCDLIPEVMDKKNGMNNFNLATGGQPLNNSYYLLKEADKFNNIKHVYLEMYYFCSTGEDGDYSSQKSAAWGWANTDYMKFSRNKIDAFFHFYSKENYMDAAFPFIRYREHLGDNEWIKNVTDHKKTENYKNYTYSAYSGKGFLYRDEEFTSLWVSRNRRPEQMILTQDAEFYLRKIIEFCQKRGITITLFSSPIYELQLISLGEYDSYIEGIKTIAEEYGVSYYDFNLAKEEYFPIQNSELFRDSQHLNTKGAERFTNFFYQIVSDSPKENIKYFYDTYQEKLECNTPTVYGLFIRSIKSEELKKGESSESTFRMIIGSNRDDLEYKVFYRPDNGESILLQDFSNNKEFNRQEDEHGVYQIDWCEKGDYERIHSLEARY